MSGVIPCNNPACVIPCNNPACAIPISRRNDSGWCPKCYVKFTCKLCGKHHSRIVSKKCPDCHAFMKMLVAMHKEHDVGLLGGLMAQEPGRRERIERYAARAEMGLPLFEKELQRESA